MLFKLMLAMHLGQTRLILITSELYRAEGSHVQRTVLYLIH